jgi:GntR family transcriptional repressor for pyruvate dehydrogenase complex
MAFRQVKPLKGYELVMEQLRSDIVGGVYAPGAKLPSVVDLAGQFGVGRSTIREALSALKAMGLVEIRQGGGTYVSAELPKEQTGAHGASLFAGAKSIQELVEVRIVLETGSAALAARNRTDADLAAIEEELERMERFLHDEAEGEAADVRFHLKLAAATHNSLLIKMTESMSEQLHDTMRKSRQLWFYGEKGEPDRLLKEHAGIFAAVRDRDENRAFEAMMGHLRKVENVLRRAIAEYEG